MIADKFECCIDCVSKCGSRTTLPCVMCEQGNKFEPATVKVFPEVDRSAPGILALSVRVMVERGKQYDQPGGERSMGKAVAAFNAITGCELLESEGWLLLQLLKDVRDRQRKEPHADSLIDCVSYSALKAEARLAGK